MPLRQNATGAVVALQPPSAVVTVAVGTGERCEVGRKGVIQFDPPKLITGRVVRTSQNKNDGSGCEIEFSEPLPANIAVGTSLRVLIEVGEMQDVVFFGRPADSSANSEATVFVLEPGDDFARRVVVRYGKISGPQIQVIAGLSPGDRVIVTDMSQWAAYGRVRLQ